jgi:multiple sugar transport system ATP-binding protein
VTHVEISGLRHRYRDEPPVLEDVDLAVGEGELVALLGRSGSGKTTLLRCIAGLERPQAGAIRIGGEDATGLPPGERGLALVGQGTGLLPNRTVQGNLAFPLEVRRIPGEETRVRVLATARVLGLEELLDRRPHELAAGHAHAVSAARQLTRAPGLLLLDEPLVNTDPPQRRRLRREVQLLQRGFGVTMVYATNQPEDAHALADRIAVLEDGRIVQVGTPAELHRTPASVAAAELAALTPLNLLPARRAGPRHLDIAGIGAVEVSGPVAPGSMMIGIRAEDLTTSRSSTTVPLAIQVEQLGHVGPFVVCESRTDDGRRMTAHLRTVEASRLTRGRRAVLHVDRGRVHVFDAASGAAVRHGLA